MSINDDIFTFVFVSVIVISSSFELKFASISCQNFDGTFRAFEQLARENVVTPSRPSNIGTWYVFCSLERDRVCTVNVVSVAFSFSDWIVFESRNIGSNARDGSFMSTCVLGSLSRSKNSRLNTNIAHVLCVLFNVLIWTVSAPFPIIKSSPTFDAPWNTRANVRIAPLSVTSNSIVVFTLVCVASHWHDVLND